MANEQTKIKSTFLEAKNISVDSVDVVAIGAGKVIIRRQRRICTQKRGFGEVLDFIKYILYF